METITKTMTDTLKDGTKLYDWDYEGKTFRSRQDEQMNHLFRVELIDDGWTPVERTDGYEVWTR